MNAVAAIDIHQAMTLPNAELVALILDYHRAHIRDLTAAAELARKVEAVHGGDATSGFPTGVAQHLARMLEDVVAHQHREELLFPLIFTSEDGGGALRRRMVELGADHDAAQARLERLVRLTLDYAVPAQACRSWRALYDLCRKYDRDFREHAQLEERVLFPRFVQNSKRSSPEVALGQRPSPEKG